MNIYLVISKRYTAGYNGGSDIIEVIKGVFKEEKNAQIFLEKNEHKFNCPFIKTIESDLFD